MRPQLSVVIPVFNGLRTLPATLDAWLSQTCDVCWEVVFVDNNSSDGSFDWMRTFALGRCLKAGVPCHSLREERPGQSAASNRGAAEARGRWLVFSAQDMLPQAGMLQGHLNALRENSQDLRVVLGHIAYPPEQLQDPFMRCLVEETVYQFGFDAIGDPEKANPRCLYAPNFSLPKALFIGQGGFDERFPYGWQDTDLGLRLAAAGTRLVYRKELCALHDHPLDWRGFCRRMHSVGQDFPRYLAKHPTFEDPAEVERHLRIHFHEARRLVSSAQKLVRLWEADPGQPLPDLQLHEGAGHRNTLSAAFVLLLKYHFYKGVYDGQRALARAPVSLSRRLRGSFRETV